MKTLTAGTLTIGTDKPAHQPWFVDDDPATPGYESAVAYAIADELEFRQGQDGTRSSRRSTRSSRRTRRSTST